VTLSESDMNSSFPKIVTRFNVNKINRQGKGKMHPFYVVNTDVQHYNVTQSKNISKGFFMMVLRIYTRLLD
jgi:hypothetical protein